MSVTHRNTSLRGLRVFCAAADSQSFREAAERLFVTASAVSHQVKNLEQELGIQLFNRDGNSLSLTDEGYALFEDVRPLICELDKAVSHHRHSAPRRVLRISVQPFFASEMFMPRLAGFTSQHPDIEIQVDTSDGAVEKHPGHADASIRLFRSKPENLSSDPLLVLNLVPAGSPEFRDAMKLKGKTVVSAFPRIIHQSRARAWDLWQRSSGIRLPPESTAVRVDSMIAAVRAAQRGMGAALVPTHLCKTMFTSGSLVRLFPHEFETTEQFYFVCPTDKTGDKHIQLFRDWVITSFTETT